MSGRVAYLYGRGNGLQSSQVWQRPMKGVDPRKLIRYRHAEAIALVIEEERRRWQDFPELGLSALSSLVGFTVSYHNNGPDSPPTMSFHSAAFSPDSESDDPAQLQEAQDRAFSMLREVWDKELPESPLHGMLNVLANWDLKEWRADISTSRSTLESMLGPALYAEFLSDEIQTALPQALGDEHSETIRSRPNRL